MRLTLLCTLLLLLSSCSSDVSFVSILDMKRAWGANEWVEFDFNQTDTINPYRMELIVRHTHEFRWQALRLEVRTVSPEKKYWCDTISVRLTDKSHQWLGTEYKTHHDIGVEYRNSIRFTRSGNYNIRIRRLGPEQDTISGIKAIGLIIEKDGKK